MGLGSTAKKVQVLADRAEQMYKQVGELREQITELRETVDSTGERVERLDRRTEKQWAVLTAIAEEQDIDVEKVLTEAAIDEVDSSDESTDPETDTEAQDESDEN